MAKKTTTKKLPTFEEVWNCLTKVNVNEYLQKKGDYDYLPWADAWKILMEHYPESTFENHYNDNNYPCFYDPQGRGMVRVTVTVCGHPHTEDYMITNYSNQVVPDPSPSQINNCLKRCLVKCMAYFGLGSYLYNSEDMADPAPDAPITEEVVTQISDIISKHKDEDGNDDSETFLQEVLKWAGVESLEEMPFVKVNKLINAHTGVK